MGGLRDVLRTMYPPVLADRGLRGALLGLAGRCTTATTIDMPEQAANFVSIASVRPLTRNGSPVGGPTVVVAELPCGS